MAIQTTSDIYNCEDCKHADKYGRSCQINNLTPVLLILQNRTTCPFFKFKSPHLKEFYSLNPYNNDNAKSTQDYFY